MAWFERLLLCALLASASLAAATGSDTLRVQSDRDWVYVTGYVLHPGAYAVQPGVTVRDVLSVAGRSSRGEHDRITIDQYVDGKPIRVRVRLDDEVKGGETVHVPPRRTTAPTHRSGFALGVFTAGSIEPIARYDGVEWVNTWPEPDDHDRPVPSLERAPISWLGRRIPREWTLWFTSGGSRRVAVARIERGGGCVGRPVLGLQTAVQEPAGALDVIHLGIASTDRVPVGRVRRFTSEDSDWRRVEPAVRRAFQEHEGRAQGRGYDVDPAALSPAGLAAQPITVDWLLGTTNPTATQTYYFEASKQISVGPPLVRVTLTGWLAAVGGDALRSVGVSPFVQVVYDHPAVATGLPTAIPLGVLHIRPHVFWVMEFPFGETTSFGIQEVAPDAGSALRLYGGGC